MLLRVRSQGGVGLVAFEANGRCSGDRWPGEMVLLGPSRELLAYLQPGAYRLRSLQPPGAGWGLPTVEVLPLRGGSIRDL